MQRSNLKPVVQQHVPFPISEADAHRLRVLAEASREANTFTQMNSTIKSVGGLLELLRVTVSQFADNRVDCLNWSAIAASVSVAADSMTEVLAAADLLEDMERTAEVLERTGGGAQ
jgi:hypothetical protein